MCIASVVAFVKQRLATAIVVDGFSAREEEALELNYEPVHTNVDIREVSIVCIRPSRRFPERDAE
jgi:hypothetical protein